MSDHFNADAPLVVDGHNVSLSWESPDGDMGYAMAGDTSITLDWVCPPQMEVQHPSLDFVIDGSKVIQFTSPGVIECERVVERNPAPRHCPNNHRVFWVEAWIVLLCAAVFLTLWLLGTRVLRLERVVRGEVKP